MESKLTKRLIKVKSKSAEGGIKSDKDVWYNLNKKRDKHFIDETMMILSKVNNGDTIEMVADFESRYYNQIEVKEKSKKSGNWADDMTTMEDLLAAAHERLKHFDIRTEKIEIDHKEKYALFKVTLKCSIGTFEAHGDVTKTNIDSEKVQKHWIRMAESRGIVRVLRLATNDTRCAVEETEKGEDSLEK